MADKLIISNDGVQEVAFTQEEIAQRQLELEQKNLQDAQNETIIKQHSNTVVTNNISSIIEPTRMSITQIESCWCITLCKIEKTEIIQVNGVDTTNYVYDKIEIQRVVEDSQTLQEITGYYDVLFDKMFKDSLNPEIEKLEKITSDIQMTTVITDLMKKNAELEQRIAVLEGV